MELRPRLTAAVAPANAGSGRTVPLTTWLVALVAHALFVLWMVVFWRRQRIGSGTYAAALG